MTTASPESSSHDGAQGEAVMLALETSTSAADVVLARRDGTIVARRTAVAARHSANLLSLCAEVLAEAGLSVPRLAAIACGGGPGSFTGLRVGMAVAKGLALPFDVPFLAIPTLEALGRDLVEELDASGLGAEAPAWIVPCLDGGKGQVFAACFRRVSGGAEGVPGGALVREGDVLALVPQELIAALAGSASRVYCGGPGSALLAPWLPSTEATGRWTLGSRRTPSAPSVAALAWQRLARGDVDDLAQVVPVYGRAPDITTPKPRAPKP